MKTTVLIYFAPMYLFFIAVEAYFSQKKLPGNYNWRDTLASLSLSLVYAGIVVVAFTFFLVPMLSFFAEHRIFDLPKVWWVYLILIFAEDYCFYWAHRCSHEVRLLWNAHETHHSSVHYNFATALRQPWTGMFFAWVFWLPLIFLGFPLEWVIIQNALNLVYQFFMHTRFVGKLGPLEWILNTPSHHRVHHAIQAQYLDRNHAGTFIIWDRLHGTFAEEHETPVYGTIKPVTSYNPVEIEFHTWRDMWHDVKNAKSWRERLGYIFNPPGWRPDGTGMTSRQIQLQYEQQRRSS